MTEGKDIFTSLRGCSKPRNFNCDENNAIQEVGSLKSVYTVFPKLGKFSEILPKTNMLEKSFVKSYLIWVWNVS